MTVEKIPARDTAAMRTLAEQFSALPRSDLQALGRVIGTVGVAFSEYLIAEDERNRDPLASAESADAVIRFASMMIVTLTSKVQPAHRRRYLEHVLAGFSEYVQRDMEAQEQMP